LNCSNFSAYSIATRYKWVPGIALFLSYKTNQLYLITPGRAATVGVVGVHHHTYPKIQVGVSESPKHGPPCDLLLASKLYSSRVELILLIFKSSLRAILFHHRTRTRTVWRSGSALPRPQATFKG